MGNGLVLISQNLIDMYNYIVSSLPERVQNFISLFLLVLIIFVYAIFVWKFYRFISKKNIISLDLRQYNRSKHPFLSKIWNYLLYILEYIIILPFFIFFWFGIFTIFLLFLTEDLPINTILLISAMVIGSIRMASYYKEDISKEIAKLLPFTLLAVSMTKSGFFDFQRILAQINQLPSFFNNILDYLIFIVILEIILRIFDILFSKLGINDEEEIIKEE
jgi:hypothetical protein